MQLVPVLIIIVAILALLSGLFVLIGTEKSQKHFGVVFFLFSCAFSIWTSSLIKINIRNYEFYTKCVFFALSVALFVILLLLLKKAGRTRIKKGIMVFLFSLLVFGGGSAILAFLPAVFGQNFDVAALFVASPLFLIAYFVCLKFRAFLLSNRILKIWSYVSLAAVCIIIYMVSFFVITRYIFHVEATAEIVAINLVMIIIVMIIFPLWNEANMEVNSLLSTQRVNLTYVIKRLNSIATQNMSYEKLADFLADHLHFRYIGLMVNGRIYGTRKTKFSPEEIAELTMLDEDKDIWRKQSGKIKKKFEEEDIVAVAELRDAKGRAFGQILVGRPMGKITFEKRDLAELEMIINIVASIIDSREKIGK